MTWAYHGPISDHGHTPVVSWAYIGRIIYLGHILGKTRAYLEHILGIFVAYLKTNLQACIDCCQDCSYCIT